MDNSGHKSSSPIPVPSRFYNEYGPTMMVPSHRRSRTKSVPFRPDLDENWRSKKGEKLAKSAPK